ncbi:hypothetical protein GCM10010191_66240 [Actinomadura vinacea]|uniref:Uncharacterized protein n=1 Tax=Actinomadura vinacea TaxID=115336 RepID=A0ABN3JV32_9ACTN
MINRWGPRDGDDDLIKPIRECEIHTNAAEKGLVVTRYASSGTALRARKGQGRP